METSFYELSLDIFIFIFVMTIICLSGFAILCYSEHRSEQQIEQKLNYTKLILELRFLIESNERAVTLADLVFRTQLSPSECKQFLDKLVVELNGDVCSTVSGKIYYQFPTAKNLGIKKFNSLV